MRVIYGLIIVLFCSSIYAREYKDAIDSTCIVYGDIVHDLEKKISFRKRSTGCVFKKTDKKIYILCAGHAVCGEKQIQIMFIHNGESSLLYTAKVEQIVFDNNLNHKDFAIVSIPNVIKVDPIILSNNQVEFQSYPSCFLNENNISAGRYKVFVKSHNYFKIKPHPFPGTSGSPVFSNNFEEILGIHILSDGMCVSSQFILENLNDFTD